MPGQAWAGLGTSGWGRSSCAGASAGLSLQLHRAVRHDELRPLPPRAVVPGGGSLGWSPLPPCQARDAPLCALQCQEAKTSLD